ncbi:hypothetical protein KC342_g3752 [Hortaea werneckii]|nr:hypothetical protein KC342_g3752 [Hortaea werneckii]
MMHGPSTSVSVPSNGGNNVSPASARTQHHARRSSRSNSLSSSSVSTIKRTGSLSSSSTGARASAVPMRSQSPTDNALIALRVGRDRVPQDFKRRRSVAVEPTDHGENEGLGNLNRWSQSTDSSAASNGNTRQSRAGSVAGLTGFAEQQFSPQKRNTVVRDRSPRSSPHRRPPSSRQFDAHQPSPESSPEASRRRKSRPNFYMNSLTALPPLHTTPALTNEDTESPSTTQTIATPSTQSSYAQDYFGVDDSISPRNTAKNKKPVFSRNHTAPMAALNAHTTPGLEAPSHENLRRSNTYEMREHGARQVSDGNQRRYRKSSKTRESKEKDKKAMLSKALQKANTAVLLDNAQNFEGALEAYDDACRLLQQVMDRSSTEEDRKKLEAIRVTYTNRVEELKQLEFSRPSTAEDKRLPARPMSDDSLNEIGSPSGPGAPLSPVEGEPSAAIETATMQRIVDVPDTSTSDGTESKSLSQNHDFADGTSRDQDTNAAQTEKPSWAQHNLKLPSDSRNSSVPAPLSPRKLHEDEEPWAHEFHQSSLQPDHNNLEPSDSNDQSMTWLDTIDESGSDCASMHSKSGHEMRRKHIRNTSAETDPDFDVAFDAAVEAAYNEGFEPDLEARRKRATAIKHGPKESLQVPNGDFKGVASSPNAYHASFDSGMDDEEEERLLDEITSDYAQGFNFDLSSKSALPRQSDSSGYSRSTWQSSQASVDRNTAATSLSTVAEDLLPPDEHERKPSETPSSAGTLRTDLPPPSAPPATGLPLIPSMSGNRLSGVRSRRMSGHSNPKPLKIETSAKNDGRKRASTIHHSPSPKRFEDEPRTGLDRDFSAGLTLAPTQSDTVHNNILTSPPSLDMSSAASGEVRPQTSIAHEQRRSLDESPGELRSAKPNLFRKNKSSVSLREDRVLLSSMDEATPSISTPMSSTFMNIANKRSHDPLTSQRTKFPSLDPGYSGMLNSGGAYLFDTSLTNEAPPTSPRSPTTPAQPAELEACPESFLLRPFWLMRALESTLIHPKGGFVTTKLFIPREVWQTRGVKLKAVEDKVANCDLLTAALGRLAGVDTFDADAVMEELQSFEEVMERVQGVLAKKLGSDVGLQGVSTLFKEAAAAGSTSATGTGQTAEAASGPEKAAKSKEGKSYLNSWRKLRNKSSGTPLTSSQVGKAATEKEAPSMASVPMTSFVPIERRGNKKDVRNLAFEGPQKEYMGSLARLFEGAQVLDHIARQVEDPGLKHSSPTHVGLSSAFGTQPSSSVFTFAGSSSRIWACC